MPSTSEAILDALFQIIAAIPGITAERNRELPTEVLAGGLIILRDGEPGEPEVHMSPLSYGYEHVAEAELFVQGGDVDATFDALKIALGLAIATDRTLGGLCDWVEAAAPSTENIAVPGAAGIKAAIVPIRLTYWTSDPLA